MNVRIGNFLYHYRNILFPVVYLLLFLKGPDGPFLTADYRIAALAGILIALAGQLVRAVTIGLEYIKRGGKNRMPYADDLVQGGIFAHCRNPLYVGNFTILLGTGIASNSFWFMAVGIPFFFIGYHFIISAEENFLRGKFGGQYDDYCRRVNRVIPRLGGIGATLGSMSFNWKRLVSAEYNSTFAWMIAVCASVLQNVWLSGSYSLSNPVVIAMWTGAGLTVAGYIVARVLKKTGRLRVLPAGAQAA
ncbi:methyltransferase family protein [Luteolibacter marinus]|uniref:methyltransferase family protein n=1 Tax=Luteolibacter marinus TaxID=2776705 RepID=UPI001866B8CD|nr:isoprenylcysteine carboxylmethyltransferase family protein [Luteolibacter marinus]